MLTAFIDQINHEEIFASPTKQGWQNFLGLDLSAKRGKTLKALESILVHSQ